jgi:hypothetical protein
MTDVPVTGRDDDAARARAAEHADSESKRPPSVGKEDVKNNPAATGLGRNAA